MNIIHCPIQGLIEVPSCDAGEIGPLLQHLGADIAVAQETVFPRGTVTPDGRLDLCKQSLGPEGCRLVTQALENNTQVASLLLGTDGIGDVGAEDVARLVERNAHLEIVYLGCNGIKEEGATAIARALTGNSNIVGLWFKRNPIGCGGVRALAEMLRHNTTLRTLDLVNTGVGSEGLRALVDVLRFENRSIERLYLGGNNLGPNDAEILAGLLRDNKNLRALMLNVNAFGDEGVEVLAKALGENRTLGELGLASNGVTASGAKSLAEAIRFHPTLFHLDLGWSPSTRVLGAPPNSIGDKGASYFGAILGENNAMKHLNLQRNGISEWGRDALTEELHKNRSLQTLTLDVPLDADSKIILEKNCAAALPSSPQRDVALIRSVYRTKTVV